MSMGTANVCCDMTTADGRWTVIQKIEEIISLTLIEIKTKESKFRGICAKYFDMGQEANGK